MTERIDHVKVAQRNLDFVGKEAMESPEALVTVTAALVHATLALVEQQRIANLIALAQPIRLPSGGEVTHMLHDPVSGAIREDVAEGLGL
ncbi:hypothetical protein P2P98_08535 [Microbacterium sp. Kw_RZR3]|uniref:hypothetical protein n=1 Tax=Microbacterium sp. Kw_RZR3 TaxID=3032903 RepID=UPI0023D9F7AC|nr:hypothetical protein [Microbacterium sp. Kw_RZR3]MDF2046203.1 hypothetical protein [Microbacterium sp. Kw_RZR3]